MTDNQDNNFRVKHIASPLDIDPAGLIKYVEANIHKAFARLGEKMSAYELIVLAESIIDVIDDMASTDSGVPLEKWDPPITLGRATLLAVCQAAASNTPDLPATAAFSTPFPDYVPDDMGTGDGKAGGS